ncbi:hypothetical protein OS493_020499 [Desmophyllum pertusum]|uniref:Uncharacterized protein n=1 Tax=Desmophyllum pertusum TaxID=174260 RepID=A0A9X0CQM0_9CNID|nr:hypothetical protein OS493_020499 [Desmophyllum pertusum]
MEKNEKSTIILKVEGKPTTSVNIGPSQEVSPNSTSTPGANLTQTVHEDVPSSSKIAFIVASVAFFLLLLIIARHFCIADVSGMEVSTSSPPLLFH